MGDSNQLPGFRAVPSGAPNQGIGYCPHFSIFLSCPSLPLDAVIKTDYDQSMTASELKRKPAKLGCTFRQGAKHLVVMYHGRETEMPRHPAKEIKTGTYHGILNKLGIKER